MGESKMTVEFEAYIRPELEEARMTQRFFIDGVLYTVRPKDAKEVANIIERISWLRSEYSRLTESGQKTLDELCDFCDLSKPTMEQSK
jgi:selenophosphate synthetase-related protein